MCTGIQTELIWNRGHCMMKPQSNMLYSSYQWRPDLTWDRREWTSGWKPSRNCWSHCKL